MIAVRVLVFVVGAGVTSLAFFSAVRVVVLPRAATDPIGRLVFRTTYVAFRAILRTRKTYEAREQLAAFYGPVSLLLLPVAWLYVVLLGYMVMFWAIGVDGWRDAFFTSGSSMLTLGFAPVDGTGQTLLAFTEAVFGLGLIALLITYLPAMYSAFRKREAVVALLEVRAGSPPWGVELLERFSQLGMLDRLGDMYAEWEVWFIDIEESHTSLPAIVFFHSPLPERSWVTAAGAVLDGAALRLALVDDGPAPELALTIRAGAVTLRRVAAFFGLAAQFETDTPISIARSEFDEACKRLDAAGCPLRRDLDQAWEDFARWRAEYDHVLLALCGLTMAPYARWSSDRSIAQWHRPPVLRRWGLLRRDSR